MISPEGSTQRRTKSVLVVLKQVSYEPPPPKKIVGHLHKVRSNHKIAGLRC